MSLFSSIDSWFKHIFSEAPKWNVTALSTLNLVAPLTETILSLSDPSAASTVTPIFTQIQADLGTASALLQGGNTAGLTGLLNSIKANFPTLIQEAHITDPESVKKAQAAETAVTSELEAIIAALPTS